MSVRIAVIDQKLCSPENCGGQPCAKFCPVNRMGEECVTIEKTAKISEALCTGCGICVKKCPFHAITIIKLASPIKEKMVFSYGENSFSLYGLALPKGVTGIIGDNGCGKTTNVKLLEGKLKIQNFPSVEVKEFFETKPKIIVKPQEISTQNLKGKVKTIVEKLQTPSYNEISEALDFKYILEKESSTLSGGELQKLYLIAAISSESEAMILDEPFAFLDYAYRIKLTEFLKKTGKNMLIIEHDLSLLSYLCENIYLMYGAPGAYGVVSNTYSTDRGINMFLNGFINPENTRFRDEPIKYKKYAVEEKTAKNLEIKPFTEKLDGFELSNDKKISVFKGEIIGIAGKNGIGKSTLCRHLNRQVESAIKNQILQRTDEPVGNYLKINSNFDETFIKSMNLKNLEFYNIKQISGGELQKLEIFKCLTQQKNTYILDEPTNMLDVNGRIILSKMLKEKANEGASILIVDHDLEFLLNAVDRLMIINGTPGEKGVIEGVFEKDEGIKKLLSAFELTYRRDDETNRIKLNKKGSVKDSELKKSGKFIE
ncbi:MAG: ATP-binding cassette domain-containing protein [Candidatus Marsarchaeota archaeon]|nr:ATP-binding cassette domain-containing protein [Candidatus Marsarchaeota archaeon]